MTKLETIANYSSDKCNKKEAWLALMGLVEAAQEDGTHVPHLNKLYQYFMPPTPTKPKTVENWINKAVPKNDVRYYLNYAYSDGKNLVSTDGHRLHIFETDKYSEGFYDQNMIKIDLDEKFPDFNRVIPKNNLISLYDNLQLDNLERRLIPGRYKDFEIYPMPLALGHLGLKVTYLKDAVSFMTNPKLYMSIENHSSRALIIDDKNPTIKAVIMAITI